ncbi:PRC and DUF2382 domain-containing protein [Deinococcus cellulosilyticus]|uniref:DUF2382 domain-containing protein n=1 Tax=Deinococcus cellulosilyticus (strain DSM 18568 / NBRC 106333 / KACC 11606 / 5516J-15) TaxID=1223518 RepID=A0A511MV77_DEIC1|nr:PRC and DUF2382 domain-containing protein [Deinococcus cellulosilyticus]GEM44482.1 hypothetical protein DC3_01170 [Deinococcus cellulosilyticus NBRC 106333 = KACC 11606]
MSYRISAVFPSQQQAQDAVNELKSRGISDNDLSFIARHNDNEVTTGTGADVHDDGKGAARGLAVGASAGAIFGLAAALIPGVGPFITAGFLATSLGAAAGGAVAGAIIGGVTGTLAGALADAGYDREEAAYYESRLNEGGVLVAVNAPDTIHRGEVTEILRRHGGTLSASAGTDMGTTTGNPVSLGQVASSDYSRTDDRQDNGQISSGVSGQGSLASSLSGASRGDTSLRGSTTSGSSHDRSEDSYNAGTVNSGMQTTGDSHHPGRPRLFPLGDLVSTHRHDISGVYNPVGQTVYGQGGEKVGTVHEALAQENGRIRYLLVDVGNWTSNKIVAIPVGLARIEDDGVFFDTLSRDQVHNLRAYTPGQEFTYDAQLADESTWLHPGNHAHAGTENTAYRETGTEFRREGLYNSPHRLQLLEERLFVDKERYRAGTVEVGKRVETRTENVNVELEREEVVIERHRVSDTRPVEGDVRLGADSETIRVDLEAERADVEKRAYVTEEVEVGKRTETERQTFTEQVGKEVLEVNKTGEVDVRADRPASSGLPEGTRLAEEEEIDTRQSTLRDDNLGRK